MGYSFAGVATDDIVDCAVVVLVGVFGFDVPGGFWVGGWCVTAFGYEQPYWFSLPGVLDGVFLVWGERVDDVLVGASGVAVERCFAFVVDPDGERGPVVFVCCATDRETASARMSGPAVWV